MFWESPKFYANVFCVGGHCPLTPTLLKDQLFLCPRDGEGGGGLSLEILKSLNLWLDTYICILG